jgi:hypothetical protein
VRSSLAIVCLLAVVGCGGNEDSAESTGVQTTPGASISLTKDCGGWFSPESTISAENVTCAEAIHIADSQEKDDCEYSAPGKECEIDGYTCSRTSEDGAETVAFECAKGEARITMEGPGVPE